MHDSFQMTSPAKASLQSLTDRMRHSHVSRPPVNRVIIEDLVSAVLDTMDERLSPTEATLLREIADLGRIIQEAKSGLAEVSLDAITDRHLPAATGELDAIIEHTAIATNSILESCEQLDDLAEGMNASQAGVIQTATMHIYEACSFQDVTGQRITKVVKALQAIEVKVAALSARYLASATDPAPAPRPVVQDPTPEEVCLTNGPMLPHDAMCQADIDKLLADFG